MSAEAITIAGVGVALLYVLMPVEVLQSRGQEQLIDATALTATPTALRTDVAEVRRGIHAMAERVGPHRAGLICVSAQVGRRADRTGICLRGRAP